MTIGKNIGVIPSGEQWQDGSIRFAVEDLIGAGAVISYLQGELSAESLPAKILYESVNEKLYDVISNCVSGKELIERGFGEDVKIACEENVSETVAMLKGKCYEKIK